MRHKRLLAGTGYAFLIMSLLSCGSHNMSGPTRETKFCIPDSVIKNLTFDTLHSDQVKNELTLSGNIAFNEDMVSKIFPLVSGHVTDVRASLGDYVDKGKVLAIIESSDMAIYFDEYKSAQAELAIAQKNLEVTVNMKNSGITSEKDFLISQNEYQKALARYNKIKEVLKINGSSLSANDSTGSGYVIKSPITGFIVSKNVTAGMDIRPDASESLFTISDLKNVWATANVYETDIAKIRSGADADVITLSYPDTIFYGKVRKISEVLDPETRLINVRIGLANPGFKLKPGMFARIIVKSAEDKEMLTIRSSSVIFDDNKCFVVSYRNKCDVSVQQVTLFRSVGEKSYIICDSLRKGDLMIARNGLFIYTAIKNL